VVNLQSNPVKITTPAFVWAAACGIALLAGCSGRHYQHSADHEVGQLIRSRTNLVYNMERRFTIDTNLPVPIDDLVVVEEPKDFLGDDGKEEVGARIVPLLRALEIAVKASRDYQLRKEQLYLVALDLSLTRHLHTPIFNLGGSGNAHNITESQVIGIDPITQEPVTVVRNDAKLVEGHARFGVSWLLATGARLTAAFTTDFLHYLTGDPRTVSSSQLGATITQPLLRGGGYKVTMENLKQAERDLLYAMRDFVQFRKDFAVQIAGDYYAVLQNRDQARNAWLDLQRSRDNTRREKAFADEGQRPLASLDQLRQAELNSVTRWFATVRDYRESLDRFKITLGLPIETPMVLDDHELESLRVNDPGVKTDDAIQVALSVRYDLQNQRERFEDATRRIGIAKNGLLPRLDIAGSAAISGSKENSFAWPDPKNFTWSAGFDVDLGLDKKGARNAYRRSLIGQAQAERLYALAQDQVKLQIATDSRALDQARRNFENAELSVKLGERRVEEQQLRMELGRGVTRDLLDAQTDLINAQNGRTAALVNHTMARLRFWRDMGILYIHDDGHWQEGPEPPGSTAPSGAATPE
jgi:outer membrane protein TolC